MKEELINEIEAQSFTDDNKEIVLTSDIVKVLKKYLNVDDLSIEIELAIYKNAFEISELYGEHRTHKFSDICVWKSEVKNIINKIF